MTEVIAQTDIVMDFLLSCVPFEKLIIMASITEPAATGKRKAGVRRMKRHNLKTDMTPMVDLGFFTDLIFYIYN